MLKLVLVTSRHVPLSMLQFGCSCLGFQSSSCKLVARLIIKPLNTETQWNHNCSFPGSNSLDIMWVIALELLKRIAPISLNSQ